MLRGMPAIDEEEAGTTRTAILAMKGIRQQKHRLAWQDGNFNLIPKPMSYKGRTHAWTRNILIEDFAEWTHGKH